MTRARTFQGLAGSAALLLAGGAAWCAPADFAMGRVVSTGDGTIAARFALPRDVYEWTTRADLGDVRLLDGAGDEMAYTIRRPPTREEYSAWQDVPLFPLPDGDVGSGGDSRVEVDVDDAGTIIAIRGQPVAARRFVGYLVDASALRTPATEMRLEWDVERAAEEVGQEDVVGGGDFVGRVRLEVSDDLNDWRLLVDRAAIARLSGTGPDIHDEPADGNGAERGDTQILLDRIELPGARARYLKITQLEGNGRLRLERVQLRHRESELPERAWKELAGEPADSGMEFETGGYFPVDRVSLVRADTARRYLISASLYSRPDPDQPWRDRGLRVFYRAAVAGVTIESDPLRLSTGDRYWRVEPGSELPADLRLKIGWLPDELVFLEQGPKPYVLAYGQAGLHGRQWPLGDLLDRLRSDTARPSIADVPLAELGERQILGGPERLVATSETDWQTVLLWSVLVLGVAVVGFLAYRLLRSEPAEG